MKKNLTITVLLLLIVAIVFGITKSISTQQLKAKKAIATEKSKVFKETMKYVRTAHLKANHGDFKGAIADCDNALKVDSKNPIAKRCKYQIKQIRDRKKK